MTFLDEDLYEAVQHYLPKVEEYVKSHGGTIKLVCVKNGSVYIELAGACHGCSMSLLTTKMVVQKKLREYIHPELNVVNVDGTPENMPPEDCYKGKEEVHEKANHEKKKGLGEKIKKILSM